MNTHYEMNARHINYLPEELLICIFKFLPLDTLLICENVCQRWKRLTKASSLWKHLTILYSGKPDQAEPTEKNYRIIESHTQNISWLKLQYIYDYATIKLILEKCDNITSLEVIMCKIETEFKEDITKFTNLIKLNLKNSLMHAANDLNVEYDKFQYLRYLTLSNFGLNSINCRTLLNCYHLTHIYIEKIKNLELYFIKELISAKQNVLVAFHFYGGNAVDDSCMYLVAQCPLLTDFAIIRSENISDEGLILLANLKRLKQLQIWNNARFTERGLLCTFNCPNLLNLKSLSFSRIENITPSIVDLISEKYTKISFLALYQCPKIVKTDYEKQLKSKFRNIDIVLY